MQTNIKLRKFLDHLPKARRQKIEQLLARYDKKADDLELKRMGGQPSKRMPTADELATLKEGEMACIHYVSTRDMDSDAEVLVPNGVILDEFLKAPQVLECHDYHKPPIGKDEWIRADEYGLKAKTVYAPTERGKEYWTLRKGGFLNTSSVGFVPVSWVEKGEPDFDIKAMELAKKWPEFAEQQGEVQRITTKWLLLEHSDVPVPCNRNALTLAVAKGELAISEDMKKDLALDPPSDVEYHEEEDDDEEDDRSVPAVKADDKPPVTAPPPPEATPVVRPVVRLLYRPTPYVRLSLETMIADEVRRQFDEATGKV